MAAPPPPPPPPLAEAEAGNAWSNYRSGGMEGVMAYQSNYQSGGMGGMSYQAGRMAVAPQTGYQPTGAVSTLDLRGCGANDAWLRQWSMNLRSGMTPGLGRQLIKIDLSCNRLEDGGVAALVQALTSIATPVKALFLFKNRLRDGAAAALANLIRSCAYALRELHLSHNMIRSEGAMQLLKAVASAADSSGAPKYPVSDSTWPRPAPLWLRLEYNLIDQGAHEGEFFRKAEEALVQTRRASGFLPTNGLAPPMLCEAPVSMGCKSNVCSMLCPSPGARDRAGGPVAHVPHFRHQNQNQSRVEIAPEQGVVLPPPVPRPGDASRRGLIGSDRVGKVTNVGIPAGSPSPGDSETSATTDLPSSDAAQGELASEATRRVEFQPPEEEPLPRLPAAALVLQEMMEERATAIPLHDAEEPLGAEAAPVAPADGARDEGRQADGGPAAAEGRMHRVIQQVRAPPAGFDARNFLCPLALGAEVEVQYVGTDEQGDAGWCWASHGKSAGWLPMGSVALIT